MILARSASTRGDGRLSARVGRGAIEAREFTGVIRGDACLRSLCLAVVLGLILAALTGCQATNTSEGSGDFPDFSQLGPPKRVDIGKYSADVPIAGRLSIKPGSVLAHSARDWARSISSIEDWVRSPVSVPFEIIVHYDGGFIGVFPGGVVAVVYDGSRHPSQYAAGLNRESQEYHALVDTLTSQLTTELSLPKTLSSE